MTVEFHFSDLAVVDGRKCAKLTPAQACVFRNLWRVKGTWLTPEELAVNPEGKKLYFHDYSKVMAKYVNQIRKALKDAGIDLAIENQSASSWVKGKYRIKGD